MLTLLVAITLPALIEEAKLSNPQLAAARRAAAGAQAAVRPAGTWADPMVGAGRSNERSLILMAEQDVPFPGKLSTEQRMGWHAAQAAEERARAVELQVVSDVKVLYHRLQWLERTAAALRRDAEALRSIAQVAKSLVASGSAGADEALLAQAQLKEIENSALEREQQRLIEEEALNALLGAEPGTRRTLASYDPPDGELPADEELERRALKASPVFVEAHHSEHHAAAGRRLAALGFLPDARLRFERERFERAGTETTLAASLSLPLWFWKQRGRLKAASEHAAEAGEAARATRLALLAELRKERIEVELHRRLARSYAEDVVPLAESALKISLRNYETGRADFAKLTAAVRVLLEARMKHYEEEYHYAEHRAMLERLVGEEL